jgi:hypothetical protein
MCADTTTAETLEAAFGGRCGVWLSDTGWWWATPSGCTLGNHPLLLHLTGLITHAYHIDIYFGCEKSRTDVCRAGKAAWPDKERVWAATKAYSS